MTAEKLFIIKEGRFVSVSILDREYKKECPKCREKSYPITINNNNKKGA